MDFAFLDILTGDKRGLLSRKFFLDTVAPVFYRPRVKKKVKLAGLGLEGCQVLMPLGQGNWSTLNEENRMRLWQESGRVAQRYGLPVLAVNRGLRWNNPEAASVRLTWGDCFILAMALVLTEYLVDRYNTDKVFLVGDFPGLPGLISLLGRNGVPVVVQTFYPSRYESVAYHMLYDQGVAMSVGYFNPRNWGARDAVLVFDANYGRFIFGRKNTLLISLTDDSRNHAPELEYSLHNQQVDGSLRNLAPIMEAYLLSEEKGRLGGDRRRSAHGKSPQRGYSRETETSSSTASRSLKVRPCLVASPGYRPRSTGLEDKDMFALPPDTGVVSYRGLAREIMSMKRKGERRNLWSFFLDKDFRALYNTIQGIEATT